MNSFLQLVWPLAIIILLAGLSIQRSQTRNENPLADHRVEEWVSVSKR